MPLARGDVIVPVAHRPGVLGGVLEYCWVTNASLNAEGQQVTGKSFLPVARCAPCSVQTEVELAKLRLSVSELVLLREFNVKIPCYCTVTLRSSHVVSHGELKLTTFVRLHHFFLVMCGCKGSSSSEGLEWWGRGVHGVVTSLLKLAPHQP